LPCLPLSSPRYLVHSRWIHHAGKFESVPYTKKNLKYPLKSNWMSVNLLHLLRLVEIPSQAVFTSDSILAAKHKRSNKKFTP
jgi:hypothetical protein